MARIDMFAQSGTANVSSSYGRRQNSLIVLDEVQIVTMDVPVNPAGAYAGVYTWSAGQWGIYTGAYASVINGVNSQPFGMFYGDVNSTNDESVGGYITVITGPNGFRFSTDQVTGTFAAGTRGWVGAAGTLVPADPGNTPVAALALGAADADGFVDFIWQLGYAVT